MDRDYPFDILAICDECGEPGAYDVMGDFYCGECLSRFTDERADFENEAQ